jgi:protein SERAC1
VFIHGLNGGPLKTWTTDEICWPKDLLPADVSNARILTFGYDSQVVHFWSEPSQNRIDNHADALLADLVAVRDRSGSVGARIHKRVDHTVLISYRMSAL